MLDILSILKMKINRSSISIYRQETNRVYGVSGGLTIEAIAWSTMAEKNSMNMLNGSII